MTGSGTENSFPSLLYVELQKFMCAAVVINIHVLYLLSHALSFFSDCKTDKVLNVVSGTMEDDAGGKKAG
ncbi:hypothetical protein BOTCAL_0025g00240 [Botryotinia calthae]|uniref:Uncharacterized protein n=1 Tax=Botryotinia calthae TaxID=38488 RepID=A0A4Y8DEB6_9HELO|nr:hypothetical protein BOTCAL_0025g00240 [Botryotinia calthae]